MVWLDDRQLEQPFRILELNHGHREGRLGDGAGPADRCDRCRRVRRVVGLAPARFVRVESRASSQPIGSRQCFLPLPDPEQESEAVASARVVACVAAEGNDRIDREVFHAVEQAGDVGDLSANDVRGGERCQQRDDGAANPHVSLPRNSGTSLLYRRGRRPKNIEGAPPRHVLVSQ